MRCVSVALWCFSIFFFVGVDVNHFAVKCLSLTVIVIMFLFSYCQRHKKNFLKDYKLNLLTKLQTCVAKTKSLLNGGCTSVLTIDSSPGWVRSAGQSDGG